MATKAGEDRTSKAFRPQGSAYDILYDRSDTVGVCGPAGTGKSRACLEKLHLLCEKYPNVRCLIARKTRESLTEAALFTFEEKVVPDGHPMNVTAIRRSHRTKYTYPNGSEIAVVGLDKPGKIMSTEFDLVYVQEATECEEADFESLSSRLRNGVLPFQQLLFDCNPDAPEHWIRQRSLQGRWRLIASLHEDNPTLFQLAHEGTTPGDPAWPDAHPALGRPGRFTEFGLKYLARLDNLTGPRYKRLRLGLWAGAEGAVYEEFTAEAHVWCDGDGKAPWGPTARPPDDWDRKWTVDFGWNDPMCVQKWARQPGTRRWWRYALLYRTETLVEDAARMLLADSGWSYDPDGAAEHVPAAAFPEPLPSEVICDWDAEGRATLEKHTGLRTRAAVKNVIEGIQAVQARLRAREREWSGGVERPLLMFRRCEPIGGVDEALKEDMQPTSDIEEFGAYVWGKRHTARDGDRTLDKPIDKWNHGMDPTRYLVAAEDGIRDKDPKAGDVAMAAAEASHLGVVGVPAHRGSGTRRSGLGRRGRAQAQAARVAGTGWPADWH